MQQLLGKTIVVTGSSGFFGGYFAEYALSLGAKVIGIDIVDGGIEHPNFVGRTVDITNAPALSSVFREAGPITTCFHFAALLAHGHITDADLHRVNVEGTRNVLVACEESQVSNLVFTSSNCLWGEPLGRPVREEEPPKPIEAYGRSKLAAENILLTSKVVKCAVIRTPTIIQAGRLGLLAILFEFMEEGRRVWVVGDGSNRYQFISAFDLASACLLASGIIGNEIFNVGSDDVPMLRETYQAVIDAAHTRSKVSKFPGWIARPAMRLAYALGVSPLGPYHWRMIAESFCFDTSKIKQMLGWKPTLSNTEILLEAFLYFRANHAEIQARTDVSAHKKPTPMGAIKLLKWLS